MGKVREHRETKTIVSLIASLSYPDGQTIGPVIVSEKLPTEDFSIDKAFAHLAARAAEQFHKRKGAPRHD